MRLFLLSIGIFVTSKTHLLAAEAGMPQLDPTYWASQAFWLILIFTSLYLALSNLFIPKIKDNIDSNFTFTARVFPEIKISKFKSDSGVIGSALLAQND